MCGNSLKFIIAPPTTKVNESGAIYEIIFAYLSFFESAYNFRWIMQKKARVFADFLVIAITL
jgi:hypothetical protein